MIMGLTGGIASGKSTVSAILAEKGAKVVDADAIAREVMLPGHEVLAAVAKHFGEGILLPDGTLNRSKLGEIVFNDPEALKALNGMTHPAIRRITRERMQALEKEAPERLVIADIPLLFESGQEDMFERILVVYAPREIQLERLMKRNGLTREQAEARLDSQMDIELKRAKADFVINNSGDVADTERQIAVLWDRLGLPC
ncbi:dephospho-CoA kinase [Paenibacillus rhizophilus]|uniref:Dephospho-CoA kinase n=1 Tax=Paenibacillus rhizophilus TaxID=1850366 RepID=A0A3N9PC24_9BACL|nr:dephospho-CoA kinase [Paenibacillus rhizophilus]RQW12574.1 dephospho-CoA kinase [Paenibacillus rhizophilus]